MAEASRRLPQLTSVPEMEQTTIYVGEGSDRRIDVEQTLRLMAKSLDEMKRSSFDRANNQALDDAAITQYEKKIGRISKWGGWIWGVVSMVAIIFTGGMAYAVFMGVNATDSEVEASGRAMIIEHNGGIDPMLVDGVTHKPVGHHPDMQKAIQSNADLIKTMEEDILPPIIDTQKKLDKRSEYQYELTKWERKKSDARRKRRPEPDMPSRLEKLEGELLRGDYD